MVYYSSVFLNLSVFIFMSLFTNLLIAQFQPTLVFNHAILLHNYKTDNSIYDLKNSFSYSPELRLGLQGADIAILTLGISYQFMGGKNIQNQRTGGNFLTFSANVTFLWKLSSSRFQWYFDTGFQYGKQISSQLGEHQGILYEFNPHYWGVHLSPGVEYKFNTQISWIFQTYYTLQINDASKNFFIGKFHQYGIKLGFRYIKNIP